MRTVKGKTDSLNWVLSDHLGSILITANADGTWNSTIQYTAFGEVCSSTGLTPTDYRFTGRLTQDVLGLDYFVARFYDPSLSQFISADIILLEPLSSLNFDRYAYVYANPIRLIDPSGYSVDCALGEQYCEVGKINYMERANEIVGEKLHERINGKITYWAGLKDSERSILKEQEYSEGIYLGSVLPALSKADPLHDPAWWVTVIVGGGGLVKIGISALAGDATINEGVAILSIGSHGLYQKQGFSYFQLRDKTYSFLDRLGLAKSINSAVMQNQISQEKPAIVTLANPHYMGPGTVMEMEMLRSAQYITSTGNFMGVDQLFQPSTWMWIGKSW